MKKMIATICLVLFATSAANGAAYIWDGSTSTNWQIGTNWTADTLYPGQVIDTDTALIPDTHTSGSARYPVLASNETIASLAMVDGTDPSSGTSVKLTVNSSVQLTVSGAFNVNDTGTGGGSYIEKFGGGVVAAATVTVTAGSTNDVTFDVMAGTVSSSGLFKLQDSASAYAEMYLDPSASISPASMELAGDAHLILDNDMTVSGEFKVTEGNQPDPTINLDDGVTLQAGSFRIEGGTSGVTVEPVFGSSAQIITN